jgi:pimeloyl-ACP methyl ester carboxylesterase
MSTYLLIHGSWHGAWCWHKILPRLERAGHRALAIDLPAHGRDRTPPGAVSMQDYVDAIVRVLDAEPEPVVLVGHSRGGLAITQAAEARPEKIRTLVYLAAFLIPAGTTILPLALADTDSLIVPHLEIDQAAGWDMLRAEAFRPALYADCSDDDVALAATLLTPEPIGPTNTPIATTAERFGRLRRVYIELLQDRAVSRTLQRTMYAAMPCAEVLRIDAGHSAYFSRPDELTERIIEAGAGA